MKKRVFSVLFVIMLCLISVFPAYAEGSIPAQRQKPLFVDDAHLLSENEAEAAGLNELLEDISSEQACEVAIVTVDSLEGKSASAYADDYYDYNGYGYGEGDDGILLLISMQSRDWAITTYGKAIMVFSDWAQERIMEDYVLPSLSSGDYISAFVGFARACEAYLKAYAGEDSGSYVVEEETGAFTRGPRIFSSSRLLAALLAGVIAGFITVNAMKRKLKSVRSRSGASDYVAENSLHVTRNVDLYLYSHVNRVKKEQTQSHSGSSVHTSSSRRSHGGSHGKF